MKATAIVLLAAAAPLPALAQMQAQPVCDERQVVVNKLERSYGEQPTFVGLSADGGLVEVLTSKEGSWTVILSTPDGQSCLMAAGEAWETMPKQSAQLRGPGL